METTVLIVLVNSFVSLLWLAVEVFRRKAGVAPEIPVALPLLVLSFNALAFDQWLVFRLGALLAVVVAVSEFRLFYRLGLPERTLAATAVTAVTATGALTVWAVLTINEHLNLGMT